MNIGRAIDLLTRIWNRYYNPNPPAPEDEAKHSSDDNDDYGYNHHVKRYTTLQEVASAKQKEQVSTCHDIIIITNIYCML
ncbi:MAG: hypothetical protein ACREHG_07825 [Candidatus Saccharimonadales bacterium]